VTPNGKGKMIGCKGKLSDVDVKALVAFVRSLKKLTPQLFRASFECGDGVPCLRLHRRLELRLRRRRFFLSTREEPLDDIKRDGDQKNRDSRGGDHAANHG